MIKHIIRFSLVLGVFCFSGFMMTACDAQEETAQENEALNDPQVQEIIPEGEPPAVADLELMLRERVLGNPDAPTKIAEHASLTCGHCGAFHKETLPEIKKELIETGEAYLVFSDFPLNAPAMHATLSARCIKDDDQYFEYIQKLFETQDDWAYVPNYLDLLRVEAEKHGVSNALFEACVNKTEAQEAILQNMRDEQTKHGINSTPSFVINDQYMLKGSVSYDIFKAFLDDPKGASTPDPHKAE